MGEAADLLDSLGRLRRDARAARHAYWFPLVLFGVLTCAAVPFYVRPETTGGFAIFVRPGPRQYLQVLGGLPGFYVRNNLGYYWLAALVGGLALTLLWYRRHARRIGLRTPSRGYLITMAVLTGLALVVPLVAELPGDLTVRGTFAFLIIAAGLCVLAWAERSRALAVIAAIYAGTAVLASLYDIENVFPIGWNPSPDLPNVLLPALVLLGGGAAAAVGQRRRRSAA